MRTSPALLVAFVATFALLSTGLEAESETVKAKAGPYELELRKTGRFGENSYRTAIEVRRDGKVIFQRKTANALEGFEFDPRDAQIDDGCLLFFYILAGDGLDPDTIYAARIRDSEAETTESRVDKDGGESQLIIGTIPRGWNAARTKTGFREAFRRFYRTSASNETYTPAPGSPERVAICDALRVYVMKRHAIAPAKQKIVFKIDDLRVNGDYAFFGGWPRYADGSQATYDCLPDMAYVFLLHKTSGRWSVLADFCGTDVPGEDWWRSVRDRLPADLPVSILPEFYCGHLQL
jgi:hypothetical protein